MPVPAALTTLSLMGVAAAAAMGRPPSEVAIATALAFVPYAMLLRGALALGKGASVRPALWLAFAAGVVLVAAPSVLSDDLYRYLWDARVWSHGIGPYAYAPDDPVLAPLRDALYRRVNHPSIPTIYPPLAQLVFLAGNAVAHAPWTMKATALAAHLGTALLVHRLSPGRPGAVFAYALNPLALTEAALGGHVDALAAFCIAGFVLALVRARPLAASAWVVATSGVKLVGIALAPLVLGRSRRAGALAMGLAVLPVVPLLFAGSGSGVTSGFGNYVRRWEGNAGGFAVVRAVATSATEALGPETGAGPGHIRLEVLRPVLSRLEGTPFDPRAAVLAEKKGRGDIVDFQADFVAGLAARAVVAVGLLALAVALGWRRTDPVVAARWVVLALLLFAPQVHPWYLLWLLPLEVVAGRATGLVWSAAVLVAYAPLDGWVAARRWAEAPTGRLLEYALVLGALSLEAWSRRRAAGPRQVC